MTVHAISPQSRHCTHLTYRMTCEEFERLWEHAQGVCQVCGRRGEETSHRVLCIDHDPFTGPWAVRGILCGRCNAALHLPCLDIEATAAYLADPWWRRMLSAHGVPPGGLPEPEVGGRVAAGRGLVWNRSADGWKCPNSMLVRQCLTWAALNREYGPHRLQVLSGQLTLAFG